MAAIADHDFVPADEHYLTPPTTINLENYNSHSRPRMNVRSCVFCLGCLQDPDELYFFILIVASCFFLFNMFFGLITILLTIACSQTLDCPNGADLFTKT